MDKVIVKRGMGAKTVHVVYYPCAQMVKHLPRLFLIYIITNQPLCEVKLIRFVQTIEMKFRPALVKAKAVACKVTRV